MPFRDFISPQIPVQTHHQLLYINVTASCISLTYKYIYLHICIFVSHAASRSGKEASGAYDHLGELDQALFMYLDHGSSHGGATHQEQRRKYRCVHAHAIHACFALQEVKCKLIVSSNGSRLKTSAVLSVTSSNF